MKRILLITVLLVGGCFAIAFAEETPKTDATPVPEPASMLLLGSGLVGLACVGNKKKQK